MTLKHLNTFANRNIYKQCLFIRVMKIKSKIRKYGNSIVIKLNKDERERLEREEIKVGDFVDVEITKEK